MHNPSLKVFEAYNRDIGKGSARIDYYVISSLGASTGDVIEITGKRRTVARCLPLYPSERDKGIIRLDGLIRRNADAVLGGIVVIRKIKAILAEKVIVAPLEDIPPIDERYLAVAFESIPLIRGDWVMHPYFGGRPTFRVVNTIPASNAVLVVKGTVFEIDYSDILNKKGIALDDSGKYDEAIMMYDKALEIDPRYVYSWYKKGISFYDLGKYDEAIKCYDKAIEIDPRYNHAWYEKGLALYHLGKYDESVKAFDMAISLDPKLVDALNGKGVSLKELGHYNEAIKCYDKAIEIDPRYNHAWYNKGLALYHLGKYDEAIKCYDKAIEIDPKYIDALDAKVSVLFETDRYKEALSLVEKISESNPNDGSALLTKGLILVQLGDYSEAEQLLQRASEITHKIHGEYHQHYVDTLKTLSILYNKIGDHDKAEQLLQRALEITHKIHGENSPDHGEVLSIMAMVLIRKGDHDKAEQLLQRALKIKREPSDKINDLNNLAVIYKEKGESNKAEQLYMQELEITRKAYGENHSNYAIALNNLAMIYRDKANYDEAKQLLQKSLGILRSTVGENHPDYGQTLSYLAWLYIANGQHSEAVHLMKQAVAIDDRMIGQVFSIGSERQRMAFLQFIEWHLHMFLSFMLRYFHSSKEVLDYTFDLVLRRKAIGAEALSAQREAVLSGKYPLLEPKLRELRTLRMEIAKKTLDGPSYGESLANYGQYLEDLRTRKETAEEHLAHSIPEIRLEHKLRTVNRQTIANALSKDDVLIEFFRFNVMDFLAILDRGERWLNPARYIAFILAGNEPDIVQLIDLGEAEIVDMRIAEFRQSIIDGESRGTILSASMEHRQDTARTSIDKGFDLRSAVFDPLVHALKDNKRLLLSPDGNISTLPFEVLPLDREGRCLIDEYFISYLSAGRDILRFGNVIMEGLSGNPLVTADPDFDFGSTENTVASLTNKTNLMQDQYLRRLYDKTMVHFEQLPGTRIEGEQIAELLHVSPWLGAKVLKSRIRTYRSPLILHIATHGFVLPDEPRDSSSKESRVAGEVSITGDNPGGGTIINRLSGEGLENPLLRSGLALAGANTWLQHKPLPNDAEDGILRAEDVSAMDLSNTELVVLSACETGLGKLLPGEGVFGLRRAFVLAGAQALVMSLWKVPDEQTKDLMIDFYKHILAGTPRAEALHKAQLNIKQKYLDPYYWGAFIYQGNPSKVSLA